MLCSEYENSAPLQLFAVVSIACSRTVLLIQRIIFYITILGFLLFCVEFLGINELTVTLTIILYLD